MPNQSTVPAESPVPEYAEAELPLAQRAYGVLALSAFKGFGLLLAGALGVYMAVVRPDTLFQPDAAIVRELGRDGALLATGGIFALVTLGGACWMFRRIFEARRVLARMRELRALRPAD